MSSTAASALSTLEQVKAAYASPQACIKSNWCRIPMALVIAIGLLILFTCFCCWAQCIACCCGCCGSSQRRKKNELHNDIERSTAIGLGLGANPYHSGGLPPMPEFRMDTIKPKPQYAMVGDDGTVMSESDANKKKEEAERLVREQEKEEEARKEALVTTTAIGEAITTDTSPTRPSRFGPYGRVQQYSPERDHFDGSFDSPQPPPMYNGRQPRDYHQVSRYSPERQYGNPPMDGNNFQQPPPQQSQSQAMRRPYGQQPRGPTEVQALPRNNGYMQSHEMRSDSSLRPPPSVNSRFAQRIPSGPRPLPNNMNSNGNNNANPNSRAPVSFDDDDDEQRRYSRMQAGGRSNRVVSTMSVLSAHETSSGAGLGSNFAWPEADDSSSRHTTTTTTTLPPYPRASSPVRPQARQEHFDAGQF
ncbi:hypothetical protein PYCC9005_002264 [Savitreella phatthalungensis]